MITPRERWILTLKFFVGLSEEPGHSFVTRFAPRYVGTNWTHPNPTNKWRLGPLTLKTKDSLEGDTYFMAVRRNLRRALGIKEAPCH